MLAPRGPVAADEGPIAAAVPPVPEDAGDGRWVRASKDFANTRYGALDEIHAGNVAKLELAWSFSTGTDGGHEAAPIVVDEIVGRQWWWEITYVGGPLEERVTTANEIHLPAGRTVHATLSSRDVIHSFWVPNLHGKMDLIPGVETWIELRADRVGT